MGLAVSSLAYSSVNTSNDEKQKSQSSPEPTFVELLQKRATEAEAKHKSMIEGLIAAELTDEALAKDVLACTLVLMELMVANADKGQREFSGELQSPLFIATWKKLEAASVPGVYFGSSFSARLMIHCRHVTEEFSKRTGIPVLTSDEFNNHYRHKLGCQAYDRHVHNGYSRVGFQVRY